MLLGDSFILYTNDVIVRFFFTVTKFWSHKSLSNGNLHFSSESTDLKKLRNTLSSLQTPANNFSPVFLPFLWQVELLFPS